MFKDTQNELNRLEAELWAEDDEALAEDPWEEDEPYEEPYEDEEDYGSDEEDYDARVYTGDAPVRNFANRYRAYNTDRCDEDLDDYSDAVEEESSERGITGLVVTAMVLLTAIVGILLYWAVLFRGL